MRRFDRQSDYRRVSTAGSTRSSRERAAPGLAITAALSCSRLRQHLRSFMGPSMDPHPGIRTAEAPVSTSRQASEEFQPIVVRPVTILLLAAWIGLVAGFLDLGIMAANRLIDGDFYRLSGHFAWIIPAGVTVLLLVPGMVLALIAGLSPRALASGSPDRAALVRRVPGSEREAAPGTVGLFVALGGARGPVGPAGRWQA